ncbi:MAG: ferredoxin family protein [Myxococcales bacterium]|nr:ferredoxin family protein [Myxococcales bacterium]
MAYVIAEPCVGNKNAKCVEVCPVNCIHPTPEEAYFDQAKHLYIDPTECIDCGLCEPVCPVGAIFIATDLPEAWTEYAAINARYFAVDVVNL